MGPSYHRGDRKASQKLSLPTSSSFQFSVCVDVSVREIIHKETEEEGVSVTDMRGVL